MDTTTTLDPALEAKVKRDEFVTDFIANPDKYRQKWDTEERARNPQVTQAQLDLDWQILAETIGL